jgi:hypothetical protein
MFLLMMGCLSRAFQVSTPPRRYARDSGLNPAQGKIAPNVVAKTQAVAIRDAGSTGQGETGAKRAGYKRERQTLACLLGDLDGHAFNLSETCWNPQFDSWERTKMIHLHLSEC